MAKTIPSSRSKPRGICKRCSNTRTLISLNLGFCKPCGYMWDHCVRCLVYRKIYVSGRCYCCYQDDLVRVRLNQIELSFTKPASQYNRYLFELYLTYLRRYRMSYDHLRPTKLLADFLSKHQVATIRTWNDVYKLSKAYPLTRRPGKSTNDNACAWTKIGYMLQELGVLGPRSEEYQHRINALTDNMDSKTASHVLALTKQLKKSGRTDATLTRYLTVLNSLAHWLSELDPQETLLLANQSSIECYLELMRNTHSYTHVRNCFCRIAAFFRWAKRKKLILFDPTVNIHLSRCSEKILICSKNQFEALCLFIRDPQSNASQALAVILILFYGLTTEDLSTATINLPTTANSKLRIILARKPRSYGRRYYNRSQILELPTNPLWLHHLVQRFCTHWQTCFNSIQSKISFPRTPLFLDPQLQHNRNLSNSYIRSIVIAATLSATGVVLPPRVLRQTCGHIMTHGNDASVLSQLGWSPQFAFCYTWLPRVRFQSKSNS